MCGRAAEQSAASSTYRAMQSDAGRLAPKSCACSSASKFISRSHWCDSMVALVRTCTPLLGIIIAYQSHWCDSGACFTVALVRHFYTCMPYRERGFIRLGWCGSVTWSLPSCCGCRLSVLGAGFRGRAFAGRAVEPNEEAPAALELDRLGWQRELRLHFLECFEQPRIAPQFSAATRIAQQPIAVALVVEHGSKRGPAILFRPRHDSVAWRRRGVFAHRLFG
jgi:hypothetical protein